MPGLIGKISKGKGFGGVIKYALDEEHDPEIIGGTMVGYNVRTLTSEFKASRQLRPEIKKPVYHTALSFGKNKEISNEFMKAVGDDWLKLMNWDIDKTQAVYIRHNDKDHAHFHLIASRIQLDGNLISDRWDYSRNQVVCRFLESKYELEPGELTASEPNQKTIENAAKELISNPVRTAQRDERAMMERTGEPSIKVRLQTSISQAATESNTISEFIEQLESFGVGVLPNMASTGFVSGISFQLGETKMKGSALGKAYSWKGLQEKFGLNYERVRDNPTLAAARSREINRPESAVETTISPQQTEQFPSPGLTDLTAEFRSVTSSIISPSRKIEQSGISSPQPTAPNFNQQLERELEIISIPSANARTADGNDRTKHNDAARPLNQISQIFIPSSQAHHELISTGRRSRRKLRAELDKLSTNFADIASENSQYGTTASAEREEGFGINQSIEQLSQSFGTLTSEDTEYGTAADRIYRSRQEIAAEFEQLTQNIADKYIDKVKVKTAPSKQLELPEEAEAKRAYLDKFYQHFAAKIRKQTGYKQIEDVDVGVAYDALQEGFGTTDIRRILFRSPKGQYFRQVGSPIEEFSEYTKQRVAIALTYNQLESDPVQRQRVELVEPIVQELSKTVRNGQQFQGTNYTLKREGDIRSVIALDGRGEVLKLNGNWVELAALEEKDVQLWQQAKVRWEERQRQEQRNPRSQTQSPSREQKQIELD